LTAHYARLVGQSIPDVFAAISASLIMVLGASLRPATRASRTNPIDAMRIE
jgi:ABC-type lipoprotein release transport system permease subunit